MNTQVKKAGAHSVCDLVKSPKQDQEKLQLEKVFKTFCFSVAMASVFLLLTAALWPKDVEASKSVESVNFKQAVAEFELLSSGAKGSREAWLGLARKFRSLHDATKGQESAAGLFYAGSALIRSYKGHGQARDLDEAIKALNDFKKIKLATPYVKLALVELKDAHLLKRKQRVIAERSMRANQASLRTEKRASKSLKTGEAAVKPERFEVPPVKDIQKPAMHDMEHSEKPMISVVESRAPISRLGNPFYSVMAPPLEKKSTPEIRVASLPPKVVTDTSPTPRAQTPKTDTRVVVIDPGHGGRDPGAVSRDGSLTEKEVTLRIARKLKNLIERSVPNVTVKLTRDNDTFLSLKERTAIANAANAELFVSIHCNGSEYVSASGVETFFLSQANSRGAMRAAARENGISLSRMNHLEATLIDLMMTSKRTESEKLAEIIQDSLTEDGSKKSRASRDRGVKQAPFYVLMGAAMPAVLVECGFISNMSEKNNLKNEDYIDSIASRMTKGAKKYLEALGTSS